MRTLFQRLVLPLVLCAFVAGPALAQTTRALPPGMTPAMMKMMMTPGEPHPKGLPPDVVPVGGCIPTMGYHYVRRADFPLGPIYGYYNGKPTFTEMMPTVKQLAAGINIDEIKPLPGYKIDHVDVWFEKNGHPGLPVPHYDIHAWYVPHDVHMKFCGNSSGKRPPIM